MKTHECAASYRDEEIVRYSLETRRVQDKELAYKLNNGGFVQVGGSPATLIQVKQWELPLVADKYDVSSINQTTPVWKTYIPGLLGADAKIDVFWDMTDTTGQVALQTAYFTAVTIAVILNLSSSPAHKYSGTAYVTGIDIKVPVNAPQEAALSVTFTGAIVYS